MTRSSIFKGLQRMPEVRFLVPIAIISALAACLVVIFDGGGSHHNADTAILQAFRTVNAATPVGPEWLRLSMLDITALGGYSVLILISAVSMGYLCLRRRWMSASLVVVSGLGGTVLNNLLKLGIARPRPDAVEHLVEVSTLSFPSGHAMLSAVIYLTLGMLLARSQSSRIIKVYILSSATLLTFMVGVSRMYLGVHWPTDVFAGWSLGALWALLCLLALREGERIQAPKPSTLS